MRRWRRWRAGSAAASEREAVRAAARELDYDRYLAALLAPRRARDDLMALAAFHGEIARIPLTVREPAIGDIRLQWWRDALRTPAGTATGNPVADAHASDDARARACRPICSSRSSTPTSASSRPAP